MKVIFVKPQLNVELPQIKSSRAATALKHDKIANATFKWV